LHRLAEDIVQTVSRAIGIECEVTLLTDLAVDSIPSHIVDGRIAVVRTRDDVFVAKMDSATTVKREADTIRAIQSRRAARSVKVSSESIRIPEIVMTRPVGRGQLALLCMSFGGLHTLEIGRLFGDSDAIRRGLTEAIIGLGELGFVWPSAIPRNVVLPTASLVSSERYAVDWEKGAVPIKVAAEPPFYLRAIELLEESWFLSPGTLPYWSHSWPDPEGLLAGHQSSTLVPSVDIAHHRDDRIRQMRKALSLPTAVDDRQYLRMFVLLCSLSESAPTVRSLLYAADQLSAWGMADLRLRSTFLCWFLERKHDWDGVAALRTAVASAGEALFMRWRACANDAETTANADRTRDQLQNELGRIAAWRVGREDWASLVSQEAANYVMSGDKRRTLNFNALYVLD
jgi:hypothetical protein